MISNRDTNSSRTVLDQGIEVGELVRTTFGPNGRDKLLVDSDGMVIVTNRGSTILGELSVEMSLTPVGTIFSELAQSQMNRCGDGVTASVVLSAELLSQATRLLERGVHPTTITEGFSAACAHTLNTFDQISNPVDGTKNENLCDAVKSSLSGSANSAGLEALPELLVEASERVSQKGHFDVEDIRVVKSVGGNIYDTVLFNGVVLTDNTPDIQAMSDRIDNARVVCIGSDIDYSVNDDTDHKILVSEATEFEGVLEYERDQAQSIGETLLTNDIDVVCCSGSIAEQLRKAFDTLGIMSVSNVTPDNLADLARATGATILPTLSHVDDSNYGLAGNIINRHIDGKEALLFQDCRETDVVSLVLRGETEHLVDELERSLESALAVLRAFHHSPHILPGGGAAEVRAASELRQDAFGITGRQQLAVRAFADALEIIPRTLAETAGQSPLDTLHTLRSVHSDGKEMVGINGFTRHIEEMYSAGIVDPLTIKKQSIQGAVETAVSLICIDGVLTADELRDTPYGLQPE